MSQALVILCTCPDSPTALELARGLVSNQLAACVNVLPGIRSIYRWQERIEDEEEVLLIIKSTPEALQAVEAWLRDHHPYDVPEVVALRASHVSRGYLDWLTGQVAGHPAG